MMPRHGWIVAVSGEYACICKLALLLLLMFLLSKICAARCHRATSTLALYAVDVMCVSRGPLPRKTDVEARSSTGKELCKWCCVVVVFWRN
jgi:hypothetical protein